MRTRRHRHGISMWLKAYFAGGSPANCIPEGPCP